MTSTTKVFFAEGGTEKMKLSEGLENAVVSVMLFSEPTHKQIYPA